MQKPEQKTAEILAHRANDQKFGQSKLPQLVHIDGIKRRQRN